MAQQKARTREFRKKKDWKERWREGGEEGERGDTGWGQRTAHLQDLQRRAS